MNDMIVNNMWADSDQWTKVEPVYYDDVYDFNMDRVTPACWSMTGSMNSEQVCTTDYSMISV